mmetsp:Transcript_35430/g.65974  ORF Transcript_35430/g.65974 Transcript_35430/m.65974 type:complete len:241 (-) Transcript_35430:274-996(-)
MAGGYFLLLGAVGALCVAASLDRHPQNANCLCLFDVDRTLTGQQDVSAPTCPHNQVIPGVKDTAYSGGDLTLSEVGQSAAQTFCASRGCFVGIITAGDVSGASSQERSMLVQHLQASGKLPSTEWSGPSKSGGVRRACTPKDVQSTLVTGCLDGTKQEAAKGIVAWLAGQSAALLPSNVWMFDDRSINIHPFEGTGMNAKQISCATRDPKLGTGVCGATIQEIVAQPGVTTCTSEAEVVV